MTNATAYATTHWFSRYVIQPGLTAALITAAITIFLGLATVLYPATPWFTLAPPCFIIALEGYLTTLWLHDPGRRELNRPLYRTAELLVLLLFVRGVAWQIQGNWPTPAELNSYLTDPLLVLLDGTFFLLLGLAALAWERSLFMAYIFLNLALDEAEIEYYTTPTNKRKEYKRPLQTHRTTLLDQFTNFWLSLSIFVLICVGMSTIGLSELFAERGFSTLARFNLHPFVLLALVVYFLAGLVLLSQGRLAMVNARWLVNGVNRPDTVNHKWPGQALRLTAGVLLLAAFLPLGSTTLMGQLLEYLFWGIAWLLQMVTLLFFYLFTFFLSEESVTPPPYDDTGLVAPPAELPPPATPTPPPANTELPVPLEFFGGLFWLVFILILAAAVVFFLRDRGWQIDDLRWQAWWLALKNWWGNWRKRVQEQWSALPAVALSLPNLEQLKPPGREWNFLRLNALSPRDQIRYFYLSTVRRASEIGVKRSQDETPAEYAHDLKKEWPEQERPVDELTQAFLKARYSNQPLTPAEAELIRTSWQQLRQVVRGKKNNTL